MTHDYPTVSIGLPVYNGASFLRQTLDNLLAQEYEDFELIIADNASTDETEAIAREFATRDPRIRYDRAAKNHDAQWNFNRVCRMAAAPYFMWASCHDRWDPKFIARFVEILESDPSVVLCFSRAAEIDHDGERIGPLRGKLDTRGMDRAMRYSKVVRGICCYAIYGLFRTESLQQVLPAGPSLGPDALALAELAFFGTFAFVDEELFYLRRMSTSSNWKRYFNNLHLKFSLWNCFRLYFRFIGNYLTVVREHATSSFEVVSLGAWTILVLLTRTALWAVGIIISQFYPKFYRPL